MSKEKLYFVWYDNGTGYWEGPYSQVAVSEMDALQKAGVMWAYNSYGAKAYTYPADPNKTERN